MIRSPQFACIEKNEMQACRADPWDTGSVCVSPAKPPLGLRPRFGLGLGPAFLKFDQVQIQVQVEVEV
jgi:hypothetical protein